MKKLTIGDNGKIERDKPVCHVRRKSLAGIEVGEEVLIRFKDDFEAGGYSRYRLAAKYYDDDWDRQAGWLHGEFVRIDGGGAPMSDMARCTPDAANAAAMREALTRCYQLSYEWEANEREGIAGVDAPDSAETLFEVQHITNKALSAPARNCDRYADRKTAWDAFAASYFGPTDPGEMEYYFGVWLFDRAEGGAE